MLASQVAPAHGYRYVHEFIVGDGPGRTRPGRAVEDE